jgi:hypothetical protein
MQNGVHEVAGAISGKRTASAVSPVGSRGEAQDEDAGARVSKAWHRTCPVGLVLVGTALRLTNAFAVAAKARAALAGDDRFVNPKQRGWERFGGRACHYIP